MIDQTHPKTMSAQTAPVVFAALITTCGVILAAFIQSGYFGRPTPPSVALAQPTIPIAQASFLGTVEPLTEATPGAEKWPDAVVSYKPVTSPSNIEPVTALLPAVNTPARLPLAAELIPAESPKTFASPWAALTNPTTQPPRAEVAKPAKKNGDWSTLTRLFKGHD
jgi:hypothetical protein